MSVLSLRLAELGSYCSGIARSVASLFAGAVLPLLSSSGPRVVEGSAFHREMNCEPRIARNFTEANPDSSRFIPIQQF